MAAVGLDRLDGVVPGAHVRYFSRVRENGRQVDASPVLQHTDRRALALRARASFSPIQRSAIGCEMFSPSFSPATTWR